MSESVTINKSKFSSQLFRPITGSVRAGSQRLTADKLSKLTKRSALRSSYEELSKKTSIKIESLLKDVEASRTASVTGSIDRSSATAIDME